MPALQEFGAPGGDGLDAEGTAVNAAPAEEAELIRVAAVGIKLAAVFPAFGRRRQKRKQAIQLAEGEGGGGAAAQIDAGRGAGGGKYPAPAKLLRQGFQIGVGQAFFVKAAGEGAIGAARAAEGEMRIEGGRRVLPSRLAVIPAIQRLNRGKNGWFAGIQ
jgi:hypothetical protein